MINILFLSLLSFSVPSAAAPARAADPQLHLSVYIVRGEHSRDSNSTTTTITVDGASLVYEQSYTGFRASGRKPVHIEKDLTPQDVRRLEAIIDGNKLLKSHSVKYDSSQPGSYFQGSIDIRLHSGNSAIRLSGMTYEIEAEGLYKKVQVLLDAIQSIVEP
jgi:hypothetical protein